MGTLEVQVIASCISSFLHESCFFCVGTLLELPSYLPLRYAPKLRQAKPILEDLHHAHINIRFLESPCLGPRQKNVGPFVYEMFGRPSSASCSELHCPKGLSCQMEDFRRAGSRPVILLTQSHMYTSVCMNISLKMNVI